MILYVNGDEHCAGADAVIPCVYAEDSFDLWWMGQVPNPENLKGSFSNFVKLALQSRLYNESSITRSNDNIISATKNFVESNRHDQIVTIIGFPESNDHQLTEFGVWLKQHDVKHILYPTDEYSNWLIKRGFTPNARGYFGRDAHKAWAGELIKSLTKIL
jgi:hypothetical protein